MERELAIRFFSAAGMMWKLFFERTVNEGASRGSMPLLHVINQCGTTNITELSAQLGITKSAISQNLNALEEKGYIRRVADPNDRRQTHIELTECGAAIERETREEMLRRATDIFTHIGAEDSEKLVAQIEKCVEVIRK